MSRPRPRHCDACWHTHASDDALRLSPEVERWSTASNPGGINDLCPRCTELASEIRLRGPVRLPARPAPISLEALEACDG